MMHKILTVVTAMCLIVGTYGCATSSSSKKIILKKKSSVASRGADDFEFDGGGGGGLSFGSTLVNSASNNSMSFKSVNRSKASSIANSINGKDPRQLAAKVSALRLSSQGLGLVLESGRKIIDRQLKKGVSDRNKLDPRVQLEIGLAAIQERNLGMAILMLDPLKGTGNPSRVRAGAYNALGVINVIRKRIPEAVLSFKTAIKFSANYQPAHLNLGFLFLKYGNFERANFHLGRLASDLTAKSGLIVSNRLQGQASRADGLCKQVLSKKSNHKPTLFNCGVLQWQSKNNKKNARDLISKALKTPGGPSSWDDQGYKVLEQMN